MVVFTLMNRNKELFDFSYNGISVISIDKIYEKNSIYMPFGLVIDGKIDLKDFFYWFKNRKIPATRDGLKKVLHNSDIYNKDNFDLLESKALCLSLSDQYWVKLKESNVLWEDINFFDNDFSEDIGKILFDEGRTTLNIDLNISDMVVNGFYKKRWKIINGKRCLIKGGSENSYNQEPFNELIATKLMERIL